jgi:hypothetical protein
MYETLLLIWETPSAAGSMARCHPLLKLELGSINAQNLRLLSLLLLERVFITLGLTVRANKHLQQS